MSCREPLGANWGTSTSWWSVAILHPHGAHAGGPIHQVTSIRSHGRRASGSHAQVLPGGKSRLFRAGGTFGIDSVADRPSTSRTAEDTVFDNVPDTPLLGTRGSLMTAGWVGCSPWSLRRRRASQGTPVPLEEHPRSGAAGGEARAVEQEPLVSGNGYETAQGWLDGGARAIEAVDREEVTAVRTRRVSRQTGGSDLGRRPLDRATNDIWVHDIAGGTHGACHHRGRRHVGPSGPGRHADPVPVGPTDGCRHLDRPADLSSARATRFCASAPNISATWKVSRVARWQHSYRSGDAGTLQ